MSLIEEPEEIQTGPTLRIENNVEGEFFLTEKGNDSFKLIPGDIVNWFIFSNFTKLWFYLRNRFFCCFEKEGILQKCRILSDSPLEKRGRFFILAIFTVIIFVLDVCVVSYCIFAGLMNEYLALVITRIISFALALISLVLSVAFENTVIIAFYLSVDLSMLFISLLSYKYYSVLLTNFTYIFYLIFIIFSFHVSARYFYVKFILQSFLVGVMLVSMIIEIMKLDDKNNVDLVIETLKVPGNLKRFTVINYCVSFITLLYFSVTTNFKDFGRNLELFTFERLLEFFRNGNLTAPLFRLYKVKSPEEEYRLTEMDVYLRRIIKEFLFLRSFIPMEYFGVGDFSKDHFDNSLEESQFENQTLDSRSVTAICEINQSTRNMYNEGVEMYNSEGTDEPIPVVKDEKEYRSKLNPYYLDLKENKREKHWGEPGEGEGLKIRKLIVTTLMIKIIDFHKLILFLADYDGEKKLGNLNKLINQIVEIVLDNEGRPYVESDCIKAYSNTYYTGNDVNAIKAAIKIQEKCKSPFWKSTLYHGMEAQCVRKPGEHMDEVIDDVVKERFPDLNSYNVSMMLFKSRDVICGAIGGKTQKKMSFIFPDETINHLENYLRWVGKEPMLSKGCILVDDSVGIRRNQSLNGFDFKIFEVLSKGGNGIRLIYSLVTDEHLFSSKSDTRKKCQWLSEAWGSIRRKELPRTLELFDRYLYSSNDPEVELMKERSRVILENVKNNERSLRTFYDVYAESNVDIRMNEKVFMKVPSIIRNTGVIQETKKNDGPEEGVGEWSESGDGDVYQID